ncbi:hypothetical protein CspeluHIS016_0404120 [Cutaneotrichosporon spelunceum]|uniref:Amino acid permease/ SLC12A domain-containing protein n=1 Tax=Cutaneotrichosporon spelunceum TaxID=1672016 RepID=A0AAD3YCW5_9TREE|nr:hypothetical protein CspeluHIS016_0404120 [Cutaneotrichosporon spelunceum]
MEATGSDNKKTSATSETVSEVRHDKEAQVEVGDKATLHRVLTERQVAMMALVGTFGTGFFLASGKVLATGGPAGALISYTLIGTVSYAMLASLAEMAAFAPIPGGFITYATRWLHPAAGFALGWMVVLYMGAGAAGEVVATSVLVSYWDDNFARHQAAYITAFTVAVAAIHLSGLRVFGIFEYYSGIIKVLFMLGLLLMGVVVNLGGVPNHDRLGFRYWRDPGAFAPFLFAGAKGRFLGWFTTLPWSAYSYVGIEAIGIAVAEVQHPRRAIPRAIRSVFARIACFYILGILLVGTLVPYTEPRLLSHTGTGAQSPWVIALSSAGLRGWPSVANAFFLLYSFSACNTALYVGSRALHALAMRGHAPRLFALTQGGRPWVANLALTAFLPLAYMAVSAGAATVFGWFLNITALTSFITWLIIALTYLRFRAACTAQNVPEMARPYRHRGQPVLAAWTAGWSTVVILANGWFVFIKGNWRTADFVVRYVNVAVMAALVFFYLVWKRPGGFVPLKDLDLWSGRREEEEEEGEEREEVKKKDWRRVVRVVHACF